MSSRPSLLIEEIIRVDGCQPSPALPKHRKMATSPFVFFRGTSQLFYADLYHNNLSSVPGCPMTTIMGDCHVSNFGFLTEEGSHGDNVIFSPNDFDDACIAPADWDLLRFCVSLILCADHCRGVKAGVYQVEDPVTHKPVVERRHEERAIERFFQGYRQTLEQGIEDSSHFAAAIEHIEHPTILKKRFRKAQERAAGGDEFLSKSALAKAVDVSPKRLRFRALPEKFAPLDKLEKRMLSEAFAPYMDDHIHDVVARLNAGTGSVNMSRYYFLVGPEHYRGEADLALCHLVEVKQQRQAAPLFHFPELNPANRLNPAHLTVMCQRRMQRKPDLVLDEAEWQDAHWLIRSRHHAKVGIDPEHVALGKQNVHQEGFAAFAEACGRALALAHSRGDRRSVRFEQSMLAILADEQPLLTKAAFDYAALVVQDWEWFKHQAKP